MQRWRLWSVAICLGLSLVPGCATWRGSASLPHPTVEALDWPAFDREVIPAPMPALLAPGIEIFSLQTEDTVTVAEIWSTGAAAQRDDFWLRVLRDRCGMREAMQVANGGKPDPDAICRPGPPPDPRKPAPPSMAPPPATPQRWHGAGR